MVCLQATGILTCYVSFNFFRPYAGHNVNYLVNGNCFIPIKRQQSKFKEQSENSCLLDSFEEVSALWKSGKGLKKVKDQL